MNSIRAAFKGRPVFTGNYINKADIIVELYDSNTGYAKGIPSSDFTIIPDRIITSPVQHCVITYKDKITKEILTGQVEIPVLYIVSVEAVYKGPSVLYMGEYSKNDITVNIKYNNELYNRKLDRSEFTVESLYATGKPYLGKIIWNGENGIKYTPEYVVPTIYITMLKADYTGKDIYYKNKVSENDIKVYAEFNEPENNRYLKATEFKLEKDIIEKFGPNTFKINETISLSGNIYGYVNVFGKARNASLSVKYTGEPLVIGNNADIKDIKVKLEFENNNGERESVFLKNGDNILHNGIHITDEYFVPENAMLIRNSEINIIPIKYTDSENDLLAYAEVTGLPQVSELSCKYTGEEKLLGDSVLKSEVKVYITLKNDITTEETVTTEVGIDEWEFFDAPVIQGINKGKLKILHKETNTTGIVEIPYKVPETLSLRCWYEGDKIEVGNHYDKDNVIAYLVDKKGNEKLLKIYELIFEDSLVKNDGWNFYNIKLKNKTYGDISARFAVPGYKPLEKTKDLEFSCTYINKRNGYEEIDYSEEFKNHMSQDGILYINWGQFLNKCNEIKLYGTFIMESPKKSGLSNKYDELWEIKCTDKNNINAMLIKPILKGDETWQQRKHMLKMKKWWKTPNRK